MEDSETNTLQSILLAGATGLALIVYFLNKQKKSFDKDKEALAPYDPMHESQIFKDRILKKEEKSHTDDMFFQQHKKIMQNEVLPSLLKQDLKKEVPMTAKNSPVLTPEASTSESELSDQDDHDTVPFGVLSFSTHLADSADLSLTTSGWFSNKEKY